MREQLRYRIIGKSERVKHNEPINSVRRNENIFSDDLERRPFLQKFTRLLCIISDLRVVASERDVIRERVEPHVVDEIFVERQLDPPIEARFRPGDTKVARKFLDRVAQFGLAKIRDDRVFAIVDVTEQPIFVLAEFEIIIFFLAKLDLPPLKPELAVGAAFFIGEELFLTNRVIARLLIFVDLSFVEQALRSEEHTSELQ